MTRVLIVGAGITGALAASQIRNRLMQNCHIVVWEKSGLPGGRMSTAVCNREPWCSVDLGAQYLSPRPDEMQDHSVIYKELEDAGLLRPLTCHVEADKERPVGTKHYVVPRGMSTVVKHFLSSSGANVQYNRPLLSLHMTDRSLSAASHSGTTENFDCVVWTTPVPDLFHIAGDMQHLIDCQVDVKKKLQDVEYSSRFALGLFFDEGAKLDLSWGMKYFDDPIIRFVSIDTVKRSVDSSRPTMLVHTSIKFGQENAEKDVNEVCFNVILPRLYVLMPELPKVAFTVTQRWQFSQVLNGYPDTSGALTLNTSPLLVVGGDSFTSSRFAGSIASANQIASAVVEFAQNKLS